MSQPERIIFLIKFGKKKNLESLDILEHTDPPKAQLIGNCRSGGC